MPGMFEERQGGHWTVREVKMGEDGAGLETVPINQNAIAKPKRLRSKTSEVTCVMVGNICCLSPGTTPHCPSDVRLGCGLAVATGGERAWGVPLLSSN